MSAKKYERFLHQTKTWIALRKVIEKWARKDLKKKSKILPLASFQKSKFFPQNVDIYLKTVKLPYLTENGILNNFDFHGWLSKFDIFRIIAVPNSWICTVLQYSGHGFFRNSANSGICNRHNSEYIRLRKSTKKIWVV